MKVARHATALVAVLTLAAACSQEQNNGNAAQPTGDRESVDANQMMADPDNPYAQAEMQMQERMMAAVGTDVSETWIRKMIEHHRGAVDMANVVLAQGQNPRVREMAQKTVKEQTKDISDLEKMLREETAESSSAAATAPAAGAAATTSASEPKPKAVAQPKARTSERAPKAATPAADPHEGMDMGNMANMSH